MANTIVLLSLSTDTNDFQRQQAVVAEETAWRLVVNLKVIFANNDPMRQNEELLKVVQSAEGFRLAAIIV